MKVIIPSELISKSFLIVNEKDTLHTATMITAKIWVWLLLHTTLLFLIQCR